MNTRISDPSHETTLHVRDACLCLHSQRVARALARRFDNAFKEIGITSGQFSLLMALNRAEPPGLGSVADLLAMDRTTLTANLKPLERQGYVEIHANPDDRRSRLLTLTVAGRNVLRKAIPIWDRTHAAVEATLHDADALRKDLGRLSNA